MLLRGTRHNCHCERSVVEGDVGKSPKSEIESVNYVTYYKNCVIFEELKDLSLI